MTTQLQVLTDRIKGCTACTAARPATHRVVGDGPMDAPIVLIGEAPGADEEIAGRPFVGQSGEMLDRWLESAGLKRGEVRVLNALSCRPTEPGAKAGTLRNRTPSTEERKACRGFMLQQLGLLKPVVVVTVGGQPLRNFTRSTLTDATSKAANMFCKVTGEYEARMQRMPPLPAPWIRLMAIWHPAGVMRLQREDKTKAAAAVLRSIERLADARAYVLQYMPGRTGTHG